MLAIGLLFGSLITYLVPMTEIHNDCKRGDQSACVAEDKMSIYKHKE